MATIIMKELCSDIEYAGFEFDDTYNFEDVKSIVAKFHQDIKDGVDEGEAFETATYDNHIGEEYEYDFLEDAVDNGLTQAKFDAYRKESIRKGVDAYNEGKEHVNDMYDDTLHEDQIFDVVNDSSTGQNSKFENRMMRDGLRMELEDQGKLVD